MNRCDEKRRLTDGIWDVYSDRKNTHMQTIDVQIRLRRIENHLSMKIVRLDRFDVIRCIGRRISSSVTTMFEKQILFLSEGGENVNDSVIDKHC